MNAAFNDHEAVVNTLIQNGADLYIKTNVSMTLVLFTNTLNE